MSSKNIAVSVRDLSKCYALAQAGARPTTLGEALLSPFRGRSRGSHGSPETFWALKGVSFNMYEGDVVGVVGRNGAGKSTLLKLLSRITEPTEGQIDLWGRVGSLLEVGTGFHPELTGRENIYLNGAILGMTRTEIQARYEEIVEFAEIEKFLELPVKRYSSGMYARLAFAVAAHLNPEILIVDEVLAVGDAAFQNKCLGKMRDVAQNSGRTVLFVSHNMAAVRALCNRALLLRRGELLADASVDTVLSRYAAEADAPQARVTWPATAGRAYFHFNSAWAEQEGRNDDRTALDCARPFTLAVEFTLPEQAIGSLRIGFYLQTQDGVSLCYSHDPGWAEGVSLSPGTYVSRCTFPAYTLNEGRFQVRCKADIPNDHVVQETDYDLLLTVEDFQGYGVNAEKLPGVIRPRLHWQPPCPVGGA